MKLLILGVLLTSLSSFASVITLHGDMVTTKIPTFGILDPGIDIKVIISSDESAKKYYFLNNELYSDDCLGGDFEVKLSRVSQDMYDLVSATNCQ